MGATMFAKHFKHRLAASDFGPPLRYMQHFYEISTFARGKRAGQGEYVYY